MDRCFTHPEAERIGTCGHCGKDYCAECLMLQGPLERLMCRHCYQVYKKRYTPAIKRTNIMAIVAAALLLVFLILSLLNVSVLLSLLPLIFMILIPLLIISAIRTRGMRRALQVKPFRRAGA